MFNAHELSLLSALVEKASFCDRHKLLWRSLHWSDCRERVTVESSFLRGYFLVREHLASGEGENV